MASWIGGLNFQNRREVFVFQVIENRIVVRDMGDRRAYQSDLRAFGIPRSVCRSGPCLVPSVLHSRGTGTYTKFKTPSTCVWISPMRPFTKRNSEFQKPCVYIPFCWAFASASDDIFDNGETRTVDGSWQEPRTGCELLMVRGGNGEQDANH